MPTPDNEPKFSHNPAHKVGTCVNCGQEMSHNVPRLGPNGGFVHKHTGKFECEPKPESADPCALPPTDEECKFWLEQFLVANPTAASIHFIKNAATLIPRLRARVAELESERKAVIVAINTACIAAGIDTGDESVELLRHVESFHGRAWDYWKTKYDSLLSPLKDAEAALENVKWVRTQPSHEHYERLCAGCDRDKHSIESGQGHAQTCIVHNILSRLKPFTEEKPQ